MNEVLVLSSTADNAYPSEYFGMAGEDHFWIQWRTKKFFDVVYSLHINTADQLSVFDVGCGNGVVRRQIERATSWHTDGTDFAMEALKQNGDLRGKTFFYDITECRPELREKYDVIVLFDVLEHIKETKPFLESLAFHLKPGGWLIINVPALMVLWSSYDEVQGHYRRYTPKLLASEFKNLPFSSYGIQYWGLAQVPLLIARKIVLAFLSSKKKSYSVGFHPPAPFINSIMLLIMKLETLLLKKSPLGTSVMGAFRKEQ